MNLPCVHVTHIRRSRKRYHQMISIALLIFKHTSFGIRCLSNVRERQVRNPLRNPAGPKFGEMMLPRHTCHEVSSWLFCRFTVVPPPPSPKEKDDGSAFTACRKIVPQYIESLYEAQFMHNTVSNFKIFHISIFIIYLFIIIIFFICLWR